MSTNQPADHVPSILDGVRDLARDVRREVLPRIPWRAAVLWGIALGAGFVVRGVYDTLRPTTDWGPRSHWSTLLGFAICFSAGFQAAWHRKDFAHGGFVALLAIFIGFYVAIVGGVAAALVMSTFHKLNLESELYWALDVPLHVMVLVGGPIGILGAAIAAGLTKFGLISYTRA